MKKGLFTLLLIFTISIGFIISTSVFAIFFEEPYCQKQTAKIMGNQPNDLVDAESVGVHAPNGMKIIYRSFAEELRCEENIGFKDIPSILRYSITRN